VIIDWKRILDQSDSARPSCGTTGKARRVWDGRQAGGIYAVEKVIQRGSV